MSAGSPQSKVRQRTVEDRAALQAKIMDRTVIAEQNVVRSDIMVPPLDSIHHIIRTYHWGLILLCFPGPSETVRGSNFYYSWFCITLFHPLSLCNKKGE
jgi:hypothetical protein